MTDIASLLQNTDPSTLMGLLNGFNNMQALKSPSTMYYCKIKQNDNTYCWGFLSEYDERLEEVETKVAVDIPTHQQLISGGQIVYYDGKLFNSDKYKLDENYNFIPNDNYEEEQTELRKNNFTNQFFEIPTITDTFEGGWYRKTPKGYSSAVESLNTCYNAVMSIGKLPADTLIFYTAPDFTKAEECTEEWLIAHQFKNEEMTKEQFMQFYSAFMTSWNSTQH